MPGYPHLMRELSFDDAEAHLRALAFVDAGKAGNYGEIEGAFENATADFAAQADPNADHEGLLARYPGARTGDFDGNPEKLTEMDALVAYLQVLGTMVDFTEWDATAAENIR